MSMDRRVKDVWQEIQSRHNEPVNAIGVRIRKDDKTSLAIWRREGIDQFVKK